MKPFRKSHFQPVLCVSLAVAALLFPGVREGRAEAVKRVIKVITRSDLEARKELDDAEPMAISESEIMSVEATLGKGMKGGRSPASPDAAAGLSPDASAAIGGGGAQLPPGGLKPNTEYVTGRMVESAFSKGAGESRRKFFLSAGGSFDETLTGMNSGDLSVGLMPEFLMYSVRVRFGTSNFGSLRAYPGSSDDPSLYPSGSDPASEYNRVRSGADVWGFLLYDAGIGLHGKLLPNILPGFSERVRFMGGLGTLTDTVNELSFSAWHLTFESGLQWQPSEDSHFGFDVSGWYQYGVGIRQDSASANLGRLPFDWLGMTASLYLWL